MEKCIFYKNGVYVVTAINVIDLEKVCNNASFICATHWRYVKNYGILYGGRVRICYQTTVFARNTITDGISIIVDGIKIVNTSIDDDCKKDLNRDITSVLCYLNSIEANGVDAFLANYKKSIIALYEELKELRKEQSDLADKAIENEDQKEKHLEYLADIISKMTLLVWIIFSLNIRMPAALDNEKVNSTYDAVIESIN